MPRQKTTTAKTNSNRLKDRVYREIYLLESRRAGSEMGLALALLRAWDVTESLAQDDKTRVWLRQIAPLCVKMIEYSLDQGSACGPVVQ